MADTIDPAELLISLWIISPGRVRSKRRTGSHGASALILLSPRRRRLRLTVSGDSLRSAAICCPVRSPEGFLPARRQACGIAR
jgi:hypothetical protein